MNQSQVVDLQVKLSLEFNGQTTVKRIPTAQSFKDLTAASEQVCANAGVPKTQKFAINYLDADNDKIDVNDDYELQMAYATALSADNKVKFSVELPGYKHVVAPLVEEQPKVQPVPEIVAPKIEEKLVEMPIPEMSLNQQEQEPVPQVVIEAELGDDFDFHHHDGPMHHGKKGKKGKGKKGKRDGAGHMPRKAIKNLIRQELEAAVPGIFDKLMSQSEMSEHPEVPEEEESKEQAVVHEGIECDGCKVCPIRGIRYKCAVRKDFDYCEKCEETLDSPYPFLKIRKAGGAPSMIMCVVNDDGKEEVPSKPQWQEMKQCWRQMKHNMKEKYGHCGPRHEWSQEDIDNKTKFWKGMVGGFMKKMGVDCDNKEGWEKKDWCQAKKQWGEEWQKCKWGKGEHKLKRATIQSNPDVLLECEPGQIVFKEFEVKNNTHWGWKQGMSLCLDQSVEQKDMPIEIVHIPIEEKVEGMGTLKMNVPITVLPTAQPTDKYEFALRFCGPKGGQIGEPINIKIKINAANPTVKKEEPKSHLELVKLSVKLFDNEKLGQTFNECLEVVTLVNGDEEAAKKSLQPRQ